MNYSAAGQTLWVLRHGQPFGFSQYEGESPLGWPLAPEAHGAGRPSHQEGEEEARPEHRPRDSWAHERQTKKEAQIWSRHFGWNKSGKQMQPDFYPWASACGTALGRIPAPVLSARPEVMCARYTLPGVPKQLRMRSSPPSSPPAPTLHSDSTETPLSPEMLTSVGALITETLYPYWKVPPMPAAHMARKRGQVGNYGKEQDGSAVRTAGSGPASSLKR